MTRAAGVLLWLAAAGLPAFGQPPRGAEPPQRGPALVLAVTVERLLEREGQDGALARLVLELVAGTVAPGDQLLYTVSFENAGDTAASDARITLPVPEGTRYVAGTAVGPGAAVSFSVDGGRTFGAPGELAVPAGDGSRRPAEAADYTHLRWRLPGTVAPGARGQLRFRAVVQDPASAASM